MAGRGIRLAVHLCAWLRPEVVTSPGRLFCHAHGRGNNAGQMIRGRPYSFVAAPGPGASSWNDPLTSMFRQVEHVQTGRPGGGEGQERDAGMRLMTARRDSLPITQA